MLRNKVFAIAHVTAKLPRTPGVCSAFTLKLLQALKWTSAGRPEAKTWQAVEETASSCFHANTQPVDKVISWGLDF